MPISASSAPLSERVNVQQAQLVRVSESLSERGLEQDRVDAQASGLSVTLRNQMQNVDVVNQANAMLGQADHMLARAAELDVQAGNGALNGDDLEAVRSERDALVADTRDLVAESEFGGQPTLELASRVVPIDAAGLQETLDAADQGPNELAEAQRSLSESRATLAAEGNAISAAAGQTEQAAISLAASRPGDDLAALLSQLQQDSLNTEIAGRLHRIDRLAEPDFLEALLR